MKLPRIAAYIVLGVTTGWLLGYALFAPAAPTLPRAQPYVDKLQDSLDLPPAGPGLQTPCASFPYPAIVDQPVGIVKLYSPGDAVCNDPDWNNVNIDGVRMRIAWNNFETSEGVYDWAAGQHPGFSPCMDSTNSNGLGQGNDLDAVLSMAAASGKYVGLSVSAGAFCPGWIYASPSPGIYKFNLDYADQTNTGEPFMPLIWDTRWQAKFHSFLNAYAAHVASIEATAGKKLVLYFVITGTAKAIDMRTWCQNTDLSILVNDATLTNSGTRCIVHSATAQFTTRANPSCTVSPVPAQCIVNKIVTDDLQSAGKLPPNTTVCDHNTSGCSDPTDTDVYVTKNAGGCPTTCSVPNLYIEEWVVMQGEFTQMDNIAKSPPAGYGLGTPNPNGMTGANGNYVNAVGVVTGWFMSLFTDRSVILTSSPPYPNNIPAASTDVQTIRCNNQTAYGDHYGEMTVARQATCPPHVWSPVFSTGPNGAQAIYPSGNPNLYQAGTCAFKGPSPLQDLWDSAYGDKTDKFLETYSPDCRSVDPANPSATPSIVQMGTYMRARWNQAIPQPRNQANITLK